MKPTNLTIFCCCLALGAVTFGAQAAELPPGFRLEPIVTGLDSPSDVAPAPDGRLLVTELKSGDLMQVRGGVLNPTPLCHVNVTTTGDAGLLGVVVHPEFVSNGWLYLYYTDAGTGTNRVARFTVQGDDCTGGSPYLELGGSSPYLRNGGGMEFGADGKLYVATGDMEVAGNGQLDNLQGKILRVEDDLSAADGNPTAGSRIFAHGVRNGADLAVRDDGEIFTLDAGAVSDVSYDEVNQVPFGGNLGWDTHSGGGSATYDNPLISWSSSPDNLIGPAGLAIYGAAAFPVYDKDGVDRLLNNYDDDHDRFGDDGLPGVARSDDNGISYCVGGLNHGAACPTPDSHAFCKSRTGTAEEIAFCLAEDDANEYCPGGTPYGDDACGADGTDEPDESFLQSLFYVGEGSDKVMRTVVDPADATLHSASETFLDSSYWADCPTDWSGVATGNDGWLYLVAGNGGAAGAGGLYRVTHEMDAGPREVSPAGSHFPLKAVKGPTAGEVVLSWEDLRTDAMQPRDDGVNPAAPAREYTIWQGTIGSYYDHSPVPGLDAIKGIAVNGAMRTETFTPADNSYFLVSGRGDNLEGTLGMASDGVTERPGYATVDLCQTLGYHVPSFPGSTDWLCGEDFTLIDEAGIERDLYEFRGKPIVIDLSAVWCGPCNTEADQMEQVLEQVYGDRAAIITVLTDDLYYGSTPDGRPAVGDCIDWGNRGSSVINHTFTCFADSRQGDNGPQAARPHYSTGSVPTNVVLDNGLRVIHSDAGWPDAGISTKLDLLLSNSNTCLK